MTGWEGGSGRSFGCGGGSVRLSGCQGDKVGRWEGVVRLFDFTAFWFGIVCFVLSFGFKLFDFIVFCFQTV